jgi:hypothetical protein
MPLSKLELLNLQWIEINLIIILLLPMSLLKVDWILSYLTIINQLWNLFLQFSYANWDVSIYLNMTDLVNNLLEELETLVKKEQQK